ncbi:uncharacterized protein BDW43DRAFT_298754 [Aspergillus alliaceus]|uniref:uncharacterized protein n=1 Tax=Petromyces alliaceus TaxID=209559 RepID=UPI0012A6952C|nr:uncharacterized protein BDW43DRAFT_298754 [Aspergillus alliaceus]KAB8235684.1 hypothetical protein BDW43DRAFT_298754 [Aspergillus alliaceus]
MGFPKQPRSLADIQTPIICALPTEADAVEVAFDKFWEDHGDKYDKLTTDVNVYTPGMVCNHYVVLAHMPGICKRNAANVAANFRSSFPGIKSALLITLGDVIISDGVTEFDFGRRFPGSQFIRKDTPTDNLSSPRAQIRAILAKLQSQQNRKRLHDKLANCRIAQKASCQQLGCDPTHLTITRAPSSLIHFGRIATGDTVMKAGEDRNIIAKDEGVIPFEMESTGDCDYADSHKLGQAYAAVAAAAA